MSHTRYIHAIVSICIIWAAAITGETVELSIEEAVKVLHQTIQCITETGVDTNILANVLKREYDDSDTMQEFFLCSFKRVGVASDEGEVDTDKMLSYYPERVNKDSIRPVIEECKNEGGSDAKEKIFNFFKCYQEKTPVHIVVKELHS